MRFGILTQYYPPETGAPPARLSELAQHFRKRGHQVVVLTAMPNYPAGKIFPGYGGLVRREHMDGIDIVRTCIYATKRVELVPRLTNYFSFVFSSLLLGGVRLPRLDFLMTESPPLFLGMSGYLLSRWKRARWIFNVSDLWPETAVRGGMVKDGWALDAAWRLEKFCYEKAWLVSGQSKEILGDIGRRFPAVRRFHLSNGVDTKLFHPSLRSDALRNELGAGKSCLAVYAGLHGIFQGLDQILEAAASVQDVSDLVILMAGEGPDRERLEKKAREMKLKNIRFLGSFPRHRMPELVASADIALVPLKCPIPGAVPSKLYEAMGSGVPVILAAEGEAAEIVQSTCCGVVVPPGDSVGVARALRELTANGERRREMGTRGAEAALRYFDRHQIATGFISYLEKELKC